jgi:hypothetical protein
MLPPFLVSKLKIELAAERYKGTRQTCSGVNRNMWIMVFLAGRVFPKDG